MANLLSDHDVEAYRLDRYDTKKGARQRFVIVPPLFVGWC